MLDVCSFLKLQIFTSTNEVGEVMFSPQFVCEQLSDHNFSCKVMKLPGINCYIKIGSDSFFSKCSWILCTGHHLLLARSKVKVKVEQKVKFT